MGGGGNKAKHMCILIYSPQSRKFLRQWGEARCVCRTRHLSALHRYIRVIWHYRWSQTERERYPPLALLLQPGVVLLPLTLHTDSMTTEQVISSGCSITPLLEGLTGNRQEKGNSCRLLWQSAATGTGTHSCRYEESRLLLLNCLTTLQNYSLVVILFVLSELGPSLNKAPSPAPGTRAEFSSAATAPEAQLSASTLHLFPSSPYNIHSHSSEPTLLTEVGSSTKKKIKMENSSCTVFIQQLTHSRACELVTDCCHPEQVLKFLSNPQAVFLLFRHF